MNITTQGISNFDHLSVFVTVRDNEKQLDTVAIISIANLSIAHKQAIEDIMKAHIASLSISSTFKLLAK
jgi:hypothetical protein